MSDIDNDLTGRVAIVTGGGSGLGRATCHVLAAAGATVLAVDVDADGAKETAAKVAADGGDATAVCLDVTDSEAVDRFMAETSQSYGPSLDCLVNNAGTDRGSDIIDATDEQWRHVFGVNVDGPMHMTRAFLRHVCGEPHRTRPADVVCIVSISALTVGAGAAAYNSSKAALLKFTEILQTEVRERGLPVRACAISPSAMDTPMMEQWQVPKEKMMNPEAVARLVLTAVTLPETMTLQSLVVTGRTENYPR